VRVVCLSDTHMQGRGVIVPDGDVLVHAGDHSWLGTEEEMLDALGWIAEQPHNHKIVIAGNHDWGLDPERPPSFRGKSLTGKKATLLEFMASSGITYIEDSGTVIEGKKFYGTPWQPYFHGWAFNFDRHPNKAMSQQWWTWGQIPDDTNVLITHTPPQGILDQTRDPGNDNRAGDWFLRKRISELKELELHVFGHIHEAYGRVDYQSVGPDAIPTYLTFVNAATCTRDYEPLNPPIVVEL
jgi:predicted phosphodiesterase